jgi:hypothetical protein
LQFAQLRLSTPGIVVVAVVAHGLAVDALEDAVEGPETLCGAKADWSATYKFTTPKSVVIE